MKQPDICRLGIRGQEAKDPPEIFLERMEDLFHGES